MSEKKKISEKKEGKKRAAHIFAPYFGSGAQEWCSKECGSLTHDNYLTDKKIKFLNYYTYIENTMYKEPYKICFIVDVYILGERQFVFWRVKLLSKQIEAKSLGHSLQYFNETETK